MSMKIGKGEAVSETSVSNQFATAAKYHPKNEAPEPLLRQRDLGLALPEDHLGALREATEAIAFLTDAPIEIAFQSVLAMASLATQTIRDVETLAGSAPLSLFLLTIASSGERKSSCDKLASKPIQDWEEAQAPAYEDARRAYEFELSIYENMKRQALKAQTGEGCVVENAAPQSPVPPVVPRKLLPDITFEGVLRHFEDGDPSIGIFADEGGQFFGGHGMGKDNQLKTAAGLSKLWDAAPLNRTRAGSPQITYRRRRGALHLMIQPGIAESVLRNDVLRDQGLLSRMLIAWPQSRIGKRLIVISDDYLEKKRLAENKLTKYHNQLASLLRRSKDTGANHLELEPRVLPLDPDAKALLIRFANKVEAQQLPNQSLSHITGFASKAAEQAVRIAGVLAVFSDPDAESVSIRDVACGIKLASWYIAEAQRLLDAGPVDRSLELAQELLNWLKARYPVEPFDKRTIVRFGPTATRDTKTVKRLLCILAEHRHICELPVGTVINGHETREAWGLCHNE